QSAPIYNPPSAMAQIRGTASYHMGDPTRSFPSNPGLQSYGQNDPSPLDAIRAQTDKIEDLLDSWAEPIKPHLPTIGRFLIVVTFLEDVGRILTQWSEQLMYLHDYRRSECCRKPHCKLFGLLTEAPSSPY